MFDTEKGAKNICIATILIGEWLFVCGGIASFYTCWGCITGEFTLIQKIAGVLMYAPVGIAFLGVAVLIIFDGGELYDALYAVAKPVNYGDEEAES